MTSHRKFFLEKEFPFSDDGSAGNTTPNKLNDKYASFFFGNRFKCELLYLLDNRRLIIEYHLLLSGNQTVQVNCRFNLFQILSIVVFAAEFKYLDG
jgi:hypothetical protein